MTQALSNSSLIVSPSSCRRTSERRAFSLAARLTWKDHRGAMRFVSVVTRDISERGVFVECETAVAMPMYRLVQFQLERGANDTAELPVSFRQGRVLAAVYRVAMATPFSKQGLALRLMVDSQRADEEAAQARATA